MSVFTPVSEGEARALLGHYTLGELEKLEGIAQGMENTNYFLDTTTGHYVLTLFEHIPREDLPFYVGLMDHLSHRDVPCPMPMHREDGGMISEVLGKSAVIVTRLPGASVRTPTLEQCHAAGRLLGDIHYAGEDYDAGLDNWRGRAWRESFARKLETKVPRDAIELIDSENRYQAMHDDHVLPTGIIHGDYFHDNVLWDDEGNPGVIDFYFACDDLLAYDLAIAVNDWCVNPDATLDEARVAAFIEGYEVHRPLEDLERTLWPVMLRRAALRTWLGRLGYNLFPREAHMTSQKDAGFSRRLLERHIAHATPLPGGA